MQWGSVSHHRAWGLTCMNVECFTNIPAMGILLWYLLPPDIWRWSALSADVSVAPLEWWVMSSNFWMMRIYCIWLIQWHPLNDGRWVVLISEWWAFITCHFFVKGTPMTDAGVSCWGLILPMPVYHTNCTDIKLLLVNCLASMLLPCSSSL